MINLDYDLTADEAERVLLAAGYTIRYNEYSGDVASVTAPNGRYFPTVEDAARQVLVDHLDQLLDRGRPGPEA